MAEVRNFKIETARLLLRSPRSTDLKDYLAYRNEPSSMDMLNEVPIDENGALTLLETQARRSFEEPGWLMFAVEHRESGRMIGEVGVFLRAEEATGNIGWWFFSAFQRKQFATEAATALVEWCLGSRKLTSIDATCLATNTSSIRLMERLGMQRKSDGPASGQKEGLEEVEYVLSASDWLISKGRHFQ